MACDDFIAAILTGTHQRRLIDACRLDRLHKPLHFRIVPNTKGVIFERVQIGQVEIDDLFFYRPSGVAGRGRLRRDLRASGSAALIHDRLLRGGLALGLFVPRFGRLCLIGSGLAFLGRTASAEFGSLVLFRGRLLPAFLFLLLGRLVMGSGKIHHLTGMCRGGIILAGSGRLLLLLSSLGDFGSGRLLHLGMGNSVGGIGYGLAHFKECRLSLMFQHDRLRVGQHRLGSGLLRGLGGYTYIGVDGLFIVCHLKTSFVVK